MLEFKQFHSLKILIIPYFELKNRAEGCKIDYLIFNFSGFFFYTIYNVIGYWGDSSRSGTGDVEIQDVVFAFHALTLTTVALTQCFIYPVIMLLFFKNFKWI